MGHCLHLLHAVEGVNQKLRTFLSLKCLCIVRLAFWCKMSDVDDVKNIMNFVNLLAQIEDLVLFHKATFVFTSYI